MHVSFARQLMLVLALSATTSCGTTATTSSTGSGESTPRPPGVYHLQLADNGVHRSYRLLVPHAMKNPVPLVIAMQPRVPGGSADQFTQSTGFDARAEADGVLLATPDWKFAWDADAPPKEPSTDATGVATLAVLLEHTYPVARKRIYLLGASLGGQLAYRAACDHAGTFAALAVISAVAVHSCVPTKAVSLFAMHGMQDTTAPFSGGITTASNIRPSRP